MNTDDESPIPSLPILSEEESVRQIHLDMTKGYRQQITYLESRLAEVQKSYQTVKDWAHRVESKLVAILDECEGRADGAPDASPLDKFCNEMVGLANELSFQGKLPLQRELEQWQKKWELSCETLGNSIEREHNLQSQLSQWQECARKQHQALLVNDQSCYAIINRDPIQMQLAAKSDELYAKAFSLYTRLTQEQNPQWQCPVCQRTYTGESSSACANGHPPAIWRPYKPLSHRGDDRVTDPHPARNQSSDP